MPVYRMKLDHPLHGTSRALYEETYGPCNALQKIVPQKHGRLPFQAPFLHVNNMNDPDAKNVQANSGVELCRGVHHVHGPERTWCDTCRYCAETATVQWR